MTIEEAKEILLNTGWISSETNEVDEAIDLAIEALEKQIPKKPHKNRLEYYCPICKATVGTNNNNGSKKTRYDFCVRCGQALDFSEGSREEQER